MFEPMKVWRISARLIRRACTKNTAPSFCELQCSALQVSYLLFQNDLQNSVLLWFLWITTTRDLSRSYLVQYFKSPDHFATLSLLNHIIRSRFHASYQSHANQHTQTELRRWFCLSISSFFHLIYFLMETQIFPRHQALLIFNFPTTISIPVLFPKLDVRDIVFQLFTTYRIPNLELLWRILTRFWNWYSLPSAISLVSFIAPPAMTIPPSFYLHASVACLLQTPTVTLPHSEISTFTTLSG